MAGAGPGTPAVLAGSTVEAVRIKDAWIRWLPANLPGAGYFSIFNAGAFAVTLVGARSANYGEVSIHESRIVDGMNEMSPVSSMVIKPHTELHFAEGGYHLMLIQPKRELRPGDHVVITLLFAGGLSLDARFELRSG